MLPHNPNTKFRFNRTIDVVRILFNIANNYNELINVMLVTLVVSESSSSVDLVQIELLLLSMKPVEVKNTVKETVGVQKQKYKNLH